jgi:hypothetical protein
VAAMKALPANSDSFHGGPLRFYRAFVVLESITVPLNNIPALVSFAPINK